MITTPTVLVLGAGASWAYGFPLGQVLKQEIISRLLKQGFDQIVAEASGHSIEHVRQFADRLRQARRLSIDAFIESQPADYDEIGRCTIAHRLLELESDDNLYPSDLESDWYTDLFDAILGHSPDAFQQNQVRVITFNFDRSFERALYLALSANFVGEAIDRLMDSMPVLHVHGDLGHPSWQRPRGVPGVRAYEPARDVETIRMCAGRIKIVHHGITDGTSEAIRQWFQWARRVLFIGFSYHELNLRKLGSPESLESKSVLGTMYRMGDGLKARTYRLTKNRISLVPGTATEAVRNIDWFYGG